jgi:alanyl-tRNA synthetase
LDTAVISATQKALLRDEVAALQKRVLELFKASAAANKAAAVAAAVSAGAEAAASGKGYVSLHLNVGSDAKALLEAWNAMSQQYASLAGLFVSADDSKAVVYAAVPEVAQSKGLKANEWIAAVLQVKA